MANHGDILKLLNEAGPNAFQEPAVLEELAVFYGEELRSSRGCDFEGHMEGLYERTPAEMLARWKQIRDESRKEFKAWGSADLERFTAKVLADDIQEETPALLEKLAIMICDKETYPDDAWTHSVCHNFEKYTPHGDRGYGGKIIPTFLRDPRFFAAATILVDEAAKDPSDNCFSRITVPIFEYNFKQMILGTMDQFAFKPDSLSNLNISPTSEDFKYNNLWVAFCNSKTPREFLEVVAKNSFSMDKEKPFSLVDLMHKYMGQQVTREFLLRMGDGFQQLYDIAPDQFRETLQKKWEANALKRDNQITGGVFSDVEGTLLIGGGLNKPLADYLVYLKGKGVSVTVFTGGDAEKLTGELARKGFSVDLLPVVKKEEFFGQCLEVLIDDTLQNYQPFSAQELINPGMFASYGPTEYLKEKWGAPAVDTPASIAKKNRTTMKDFKIRAERIKKLKY